MTESMIEVRELTKHYGAVRALRGVSFEVPRGQVVGLLGPNGAGKTTTMRILTGFLAPTDGSARVEGLDVVEDTPDVRRRIGYLPEGNPLYTELRVTEALAFTARLHGLPRDKRAVAIGRGLEAAGLLGYERRLVGQLSKGLRQRVGLAQALMHEPPVLILDEPTSGLDPNQQEEMRELIRTLGADRTVMLSTHILPEVEAVCDRALIVSDGRLVADGSVEEMRREQAEGARARLVVRGGEGEIRDALAGSGEIVSITIVPDDESVFDIHIELSGEEREGMEALSGAVLAAGLKLSHLSAEVASLEQIFARLTLQGPDETDGVAS